MKLNVNNYYKYDDSNQIIYISVLRQYDKDVVIQKHTNDKIEVYLTNDEEFKKIKLKKITEEEFSTNAFIFE